jgi:hypothetical protein
MLWATLANLTHIMTFPSFLPAAIERCQTSAPGAFVETGTDFVPADDITLKFPGATPASNFPKAGK